MLLLLLRMRESAVHALVERSLRRWPTVWLLLLLLLMLVRHVGMHDRLHADSVARRRRLRLHVRLLSERLHRWLLRWWTHDGGGGSSDGLVTFALVVFFRCSRSRHSRDATPRHATDERQFRAWWQTCVTLGNSL